MDTNRLWSVFLETGSPEVYLLFAAARRMEDVHVFDSQGTGSSRYGLQ